MTEMATHRKENGLATHGKNGLATHRKKNGWATHKGKWMGNTQEEWMGNTKEGEREGNAQKGNPQEGKWMGNTQVLTPPLLVPLRTTPELSVQSPA